MLIIYIKYKIYAPVSRNNRYILKYANICKISLHIYNQGFMNQIYIILGYNFGCAKKNMPSYKHPSSIHNY
jgi:hypothetical protein